MSGASTGSRSASGRWRSAVTAADRIQRYEFFDVGDADQALARFAELCTERE